MSKPRIFMSYSHADADWCRPFAMALRAEGFDLWFDEQFAIGEPWVPVSEHELESRELFLLVLTPDAWASEWVQREFQLALITKRRILPLKLKETTISGFLLTLQWISVEGLDTVLAAQTVTHALGNPEPPPPVQVATAPTVLQARPALPDATKPADPTQAVTPNSVVAMGQPKLFLWSIHDAAPPRIVTIPGDQLTIGRDFDNDLVLSDPAISRHHALLTDEHSSDEPRLWTLRAHPGAGPIYVNGHSYTEVVLRPFDQIVLGATMMRFELSNAQQRKTLTETSIHSPLLIVDCPLCHFVAPLRDPQILLGRAPECGLIIPSPIVARKQAELQRLAGGGYTITNFGGSNPLLWQRQPVQQHSLINGDTLTIDAQIPALAVIMRYSISAL